MSPGQTKRILRPIIPAAITAAFALLGACPSFANVAVASPDGVTGNADAAIRARIAAVARDAMTNYNLRALIIRMTIDGQDVYTGAMGESLSGAPATPDIHFRNGAFAFTYIGEIFAKHRRCRLGDSRYQTGDVAT